MAQAKLGVPGPDAVLWGKDCMHTLIQNMQEEK